MTHPTPLPAWCECRVWLGRCSACVGDDSERSTRSSVVEHGTPQTEKKASGKDSHISSSSDNDFQDFVRKSLTSNKSALDDVAQKLNQVLVNQTALENRLTDLEPKVVKNSSDIRDVTQSLDFESDRVTTAEKTISVKQQELNAQSRELHTMSTAMVNLQSQVLDLERYTRGYNIRIFGVSESQGEVCKEKVDRILADKFAVESAIENAHRTGKNRIRSSKTHYCPFLQSLYTPCCNEGSERKTPQHKYQIRRWPYQDGSGRKESSETLWKGKEATFRTRTLVLQKYPYYTEWNKNVLWQSIMMCCCSMTIKFKSFFAIIFFCSVLYLTFLLITICLRDETTYFVHQHIQSWIT